MYSIKIKYFIKSLFLLLLIIVVTNCASIQTVSTPPQKFEPSRPTTDKDLISEWQRALIKIKEWEVWAIINELFESEIEK